MNYTISGFIDTIHFPTHSHEECAAIIIFDSLSDDSPTGNELEIRFPASFAKNLRIGMKITCDLKIHDESIV